MITRRQFLSGCLGAMAAVSGFSFLTEYPKIHAVYNSIPILLYHRVGPETDDLTISVKRFRDDMEYLCQEGYSTLSLNQLKQHMISPHSSLPPKPIAITFDDGYLDNYTNAFPVLQEYAMKASFYIITGMVGQSDRLSVSQIREMEAAGMDFGSHTVTHRPLADLTPQEVTEELVVSKSQLEQMIAKSVDFIAYPCGSYSQDTLNAVNAAKYTGGFTVHPGCAIFTNDLAIRRMPIFHFDRSIAYIMMRKGIMPDFIC